MGEADLKVTYEDLDGREQSYVFTLRVGGDVYSVFMDSEGLRRSAHPGEEIELIADASHEYYDENGDYRKEKTGLGYIWGFEYGGEYAELEVHGDDPSRATLRFRNLPEGRDQIDEEVRVFVRVLDAGGEDTAAYDSTGIFVRTDYTVVWPLLSCWYLEVGESIEKEKFEVRRYVWGEENYEVLDGSCEISYEWHFDRNALSILRETEDGAVELLDGERTRSNTFTITRKKGWDTGFSVRAVWTDENGDERDSWTNYRFLNKNYDLWFEEHDRQVYTDTAQAPELVLHTDGLGDGWKDRLDLEIVAGRWDDDAWEEVFDPDADPAAWELLEEGGLIRVRLAEQFLAGFRNGDIRVLAEVYPKGAAREEENRIAEADAWFHVREARVEYERENDRDMLTGWDGTVNAFYNVYVENEQYPEGRNEQYRVTEVKVADDRPWDGGAGPVVTDFHRDQNDNNPDEEYWWYYRVENSGEADLEVTYLDLEGREQKYIFTLHVGGDVYSVHMDSEGGERNSLPGGTIELFASASHEYYDEDGEYRNDREGLGYQWSFECGGEYADIEHHEDDPSKVTLRFRKLPEGKSRIDEEVRVGVRILNARGEETGGYDSVGFWVCSEYREIWPLMLDTELDVGGTVADRKFEVRSYMLGRDGYEVVDDDYDVRYEWHYDQNALAVTEKRDGESVMIPDGGSGSGAVYSLTRKKDWHTDYSIRAVWTNRSGDEEEVWGNYFFSGRDYEWEIEGGEEQEISDDEEKVFAVDASRLGSFAGDVRFVVNYRAADSREQFEASLSGLPESERPVEGRDYVIGDDGAVYWDMDEGEEYSICPDGRSVMISGDLVERRIRGSLCTDRRFRSEFYIGTALFYEGDNLRGWRWCKVQLNRTGKSVQDLSAENVEMTMFDAPILAVSGAKGSLSFESGDESVVKVGSDGRLTPVSIGTAAVTVRAEKTDNYRPGKTKCLVSVTALDIVHAVLTTGAPAKGYVYDGKAKKPSVKVVYAGRTLTSGTDYTVEYPSDLIKAGKKTVTVRGRGNCTGRAKVSFSITKAAQSVTVVKSSYSKTFGDKAFSLGAKAKTALTYKSANTKVAKVSSKGTVTIVGAGSVKITITAEEGTNYSKAVRNVTVKVAKAAPVIKVKTASGTLKASDLKKAAKNFNPGITVNSKAKMTFKRVSGSKFITVNTGTGVLKVAKNTKAGKYQVKVKITAAAKGNYTSGTKTVTITVKVK